MKTHTFLELLLLLGLFLSGSAALIYEITWTRALSQVMGSTTYALSTMLASFMAGLALGGYVGGIWADRIKNPAMCFGLLEAGIAILGLLTFIAIKDLSPVYAWLFYTFHLNFYSFSFVQFIVSFAIMLVPTILMGATFPVVLKARAKNLERMGREAGDAYSVNSLGAVAGAIGAGFILVPLAGSAGTVLFAAIINLVAGCTVLICIGRWKMAAASVFIFLLIFAPFQYLQKTRLAFSFYFADKWGNYSNFKEVRKNANPIFHKEGVQGEVTLFEGNPPVLISGGKLEGGGTLYHSLIADIALSSHPNPREILNIGLGSGNTLATIAMMPDAQVDSVEISPEVMEATRRFIRPNLFADQRINHVTADARNFLLLSEKNYDAIVSVPSLPVEFASSSLLTKEFLSLAKGRLKKNGIFAQWVDYYLFSKEDIRTLIRTFFAVFPHTAVWHTQSNIIMLIGSGEPFALSPDEVKEKVMVSYPENADAFFLGMGPEQVRSAAWITGQTNTDDLPVLEFRLAQSIILGERTISEGKGLK